jgi:hypothetical protein
VLFVDDDIMVRQELKAVLDAYADVELIGEAGNGEEVVWQVDQLHPTVVVMDINMPKMDGGEEEGDSIARCVIPHVTNSELRHTSHETVSLPRRQRRTEVSSPLSEWRSSGGRRDLTVFSTVRFNRCDILRIELQKFLDGIEDHGIDEVVIFMNESIPQAGRRSKGGGKVRR